MAGNELVSSGIYQKGIFSLYLLLLLSVFFSSFDNQTVIMKSIEYGLGWQNSGVLNMRALSIVDGSFKNNIIRYSILRSFVLFL